MELTLKQQQYKEATLLAAIEYLKKGYSVFPCRKDKTPQLGKGEIQQLRSERATEQQVKEWWDKWPLSTIGIVTGRLSNLSVIDIDIYKGGDPKPFPKTFSVKTGNGGLHLWYSYVEGLTISANAYPQFPHVDIRNDGGYIIAPPSVTDYLNDKEKRVGGLYQVLEDLPKVPFPMEMFPKSEAKKSSGKLISIKNLRELKEGDGRNDAFSRHIGRMLQLERDETKWDSGVWETVVIFNSTIKEPLSEKELRSVYESIKSAEAKKRRDSGDMGYTPKEQAELVVTFDGVLLQQKPHWKIRILGELQEIYEYQNGVYIRIPRPEVENIISDKMLRAGLKDMRKVSRLKDVYSNVRSRLATEKGKSFTPQDELINGHVINMKNGLYNMNTGLFTPHTPDFISTVQIPIEYNPEALAPRWVQFINEVTMGDQDTGRLLQQITGYCLTRRVNQQKAFILHGEGRNGKSKYTSILGKLVGFENMRALSLKALQSDVMIDSLDGKILNITEEKSESYIESDRLKSLITGETQTANPKYKDPKTFRPFCKFIFAFNGLPRFNDTSLGLYRRFIFIPFNAKFEGKNDDKQLEQKLVAELPGIFNWALEGLKLLEEEGSFHETEGTKESMENFKLEGSSVSQFVSEWFLPGERNDPELDLEILFSMYTTFCQESGLKPKSKIAFSREVSQIYLKDWNIERVYKSVRVDDKVIKKVFYKGLKVVYSDKYKNAESLINFNRVGGIEM